MCEVCDIDGFRALIIDILLAFVALIGFRVSIFSIITVSAVSPKYKYKFSNYLILTNFLHQYKYTKHN